MGVVASMLGLPDSDISYLNDIGHQIVYSATQRAVDQFNSDMQAAMTAFVARDVEEHHIKYKAIGGGMLPERARLARTAAVKATGEWEVGFPLKDYGDELATDFVTRAYMTVQEWDRQVSNVLARAAVRLRTEILKPILNNTERTVADELYGDIKIEPLANGDAVIYPPVLGATAGATETHYLASGYTTANISDTNNPCVTIVNEIEEHFGAPTGGSEIVTFINPAEKGKIAALSNFIEVVDSDIRAGANTAIPVNLPTVPGRILGRCDGTWVVEWRVIPATYLVAVHLEAEAPLLRRVDSAASGLPRGTLTLRAADEQHPFETFSWVHRYGFGTANRLNGVVMMTTTGSYAIPTGYA